MFEMNTESCTGTLLKSLHLSIPCPSPITSLKEHLFFYQSTLQGANVKLVLGWFSLDWFLLLTRGICKTLFLSSALFTQQSIAALN